MTAAARARPPAPARRAPGEAIARRSTTSTPTTARSTPSRAISLDGRAGRDRHPDRGQRRRQDDDPQDDHGLLHPRQGTVTFEGKDISRTAAHQLVRPGIGHAPEGRRIFSRLTVLENLQMGAFTRAPGRRSTPTSSGSSTLFPRLRERTDQQGGTLSGGEQQMLAIGRALMSRPRVLLLDEPSLGLSPILVQQIFDDRSRRSTRQGTTILLVEQNALQALLDRPSRLRPPDRRGRPVRTGRGAARERDGPQGLPRRGLTPGVAQRR